MHRKMKSNSQFKQYFLSNLKLAAEVLQKQSTFLQAQFKHM